MVKKFIKFFLRFFLNLSAAVIKTQRGIKGAAPTVYRFVTLRFWAENIVATAARFQYTKKVPTCNGEALYLLISEIFK